MTTEISSGPYPAWVRETRPPVPLPPPRSCDCQLHIYGDPQKYPVKPGYTYLPPHASFENGKKMLGVLGIERGVIVSPTPYDTDHRLLIDTLTDFTPAERKSWRATCIIRDNVTDRELEQLKALGTVGARFNIAKRYEDFSKKYSFGHSRGCARSAGMHGYISIRRECLNSATH